MGRGGAGIAERAIVQGDATYVLFGASVTGRDGFLAVVP